MNTKLTQFQSFPTLVVEDDEFSKEILVEMLSMLGITADSAKDGIEAVEKAKAKNYELIIMDIRMPRKDGNQATKEIRELPIKQPIIIGLTAYTLPADTNKCAQNGMQSHLIKPMEIEQLIVCLKKFFPHHILRDGS